MKNYTDELYEMQKQHTKQVNLMLSHNLISDFRQMYDTLKERKRICKKQNYGINDGRELVWINERNAYHKQILIQTQNQKFIIELSEMYEYVDFKVLEEPFYEVGKYQLDGDKTRTIYQWYTSTNEPNTEFDLTVKNMKEIVYNSAVLESFLLNWQSLNCNLTEDE